jgi:glycosyltransferase involved in cell wall biosynthesis
MISVVLVTYNRAERLRLSVSDILNQTLKDFELIICDDASPDNTEQVCRVFERTDSRVKYFRHQKNLGMPGNLNFGIKQARSEYIAILHDGDRFNPELLQVWYDGLTKNPSAGFAFNSIGVTDKNDQLTNYYREFNEGLVSRNLLLRNVFFRRWKFDSPVYGEAMVRRNCIYEDGLKSEFGFYADVDLWMNILHSNDAYYSATTLITGPSKEVQPRLFDDKAIVSFLYLYEMHYRHRSIEFKAEKATLFAELLRFYVYAIAGVCYLLLLIVKNGSLESYYATGQIILKRKKWLLLFWVPILILAWVSTIFKSKTKPVLIKSV